MQIQLLSLVLLTVASAEWIDIDWSKVRPIEEFDHYWARLPVEMQHLRHKEPNRRIVNGQEATPGQFPYQAVTLGEFELGIGVCGATILTANYLLTAAHCMQDSAGGIAIMGAHNRLENEPSQQRIAYSVEDMNIHPGYTLTNVRNDIATVRMREAIVFNDRVVPVRLPARYDVRTFAGMMGTVSGFGRTADASWDLSPVMRYALNPVMTNADCLAAFGNENLIQAQNICQSGDGGRGACNSDSGGPLTVTDAGSTLQVGVVSFGAATGCEAGMPVAFARITFFLDWIEENSDVVIEP